MQGASAAVSQIIDAPPEAVYRIISDYRTGHPQILPKGYFTSLVVEQGGQGAGTVIRVGMKALGVVVNYRLTVSEPQPGRVLREEDPAAGVVTTFTVSPLDGGRRSQVEIATEWKPKPGFAGLMERLINPMVARRIYKQELDLLAGRVKQG
jgi:hypothetical protein